MLVRNLILQHTNGISLEFFAAKLKSNGVEDLSQQRILKINSTVEQWQRLQSIFCILVKC